MSKDTLYIVVALVIVAVIASLLIISDYMGRENKFTTKHSSTNMVTETTTSIVSPASTPWNKTQYSTSTYPETEELTIYRMASYYEELVIQLSTRNLTSNNVSVQAVFGLKRINYSTNQVLYVEVYVSNTTSKTIDLILGLGIDDRIIYVSGTIHGTPINDTSKAGKYLLNIKSILFPLVFYGGENEAKARINDVFSKGKYNLSGIEKTIFSIGGLSFKAYKVVLRNGSNFVEENITLAEIIPNTWIVVKIETLYPSNTMQIYEVKILKP